MADTFPVLDVFGLALLSRFSVRPGFVTLRQRFVRRCQGANCLLWGLKDEQWDRFSPEF
jgi:hypothetical protein